MGGGAASQRPDDGTGKDTVGSSGRTGGGAAPWEAGPTYTIRITFIEVIHDVDDTRVREHSSSTPPASRWRECTVESVEHSVPLQRWQQRGGPSLQLTALSTEVWDQYMLWARRLRWLRDAIT